MALCKYCDKVEVAWLQLPDRKWVACHAQLDADGGVVRKAVRSGLRTVMRPVPDAGKPHFPVPTDKLSGRVAAGESASWCPEWTPAKAAARPRPRSKMRRAGWTRGPESESVSTTPPTAEVTSDAALAGGIASAEPILSGTIVDEASVTATREPASASDCIPKPEELLSLAHRAAWKRADAAIRCKILPTRVMLWGPPGTGKTELPWRIAQEKGWTHVYQLCTEETPGTELLGHLIVQGGSTVWCDGTLGRAIRASHNGPVVYVLDEIGRASQDAQSACLLALTNPESLRLTLRSGEVIAPRPENWHCVATSNDSPEMLAPALADRLHINVRLVAPNPELVRSMTTAEARRLACAASREYSIRALLTYDRLVAGGLKMTEAARLVWEPEVAQSFLDAARVERGGRS